MIFNCTKQDGGDLTLLSVNAHEIPITLHQLQSACLNGGRVGP